MTRRLLAILLFAATAVAVASPARAALKIIATTEDLASLAREIGGDRVQAEALARGYQDPHFVEAKPSFVIKLHGADLLVVVGRELEQAWLPALITQSRNARVQPGGPGYLDASLTARILEIPAGQVTRAMGDVHPLGNPHYWLHPDNGRRVAQAIQKKLTELQPGDAAYFAQRYADFDKRLAAAEQRWAEMMAPHKGVKVVTYHRSWPNFADAFGLDVVGYVEPKPGIPPSPAHILALIQDMKRQNIKLILVEPYFDTKTPERVAQQSGASVVVLYPSVGGTDRIRTYVDLFDYDLKTLVEAIRKSGAR
ncbi:MAG TPA: metal ABC transporter substrate-binding protein [Vicinamibacterales bacterium]|nr:metal ABC transporter substrate-binding protein [Vicinamibacterales bacterium]